jgi:lipoate-protein ligase B
MNRTLQVAQPGVVDYERAVDWQEALVEARRAGGADALLLLEHPAVTRSDAAPTSAISGSRRTDPFRSCAPAAAGR